MDEPLLPAPGIVRQQQRATHDQAYPDDYSELPRRLGRDLRQHEQKAERTEREAEAPHEHAHSPERPDTSMKAAASDAYLDSYAEWLL